MNSKERAIEAYKKEVEEVLEFLFKNNASQKNELIKKILESPEQGLLALDKLIKKKQTSTLSDDKRNLQ